MASCVGNIHTKNYHNLIIGFQVTVENDRDVFWDTVCTQKATSAFPGIFWRDGMQSMLQILMKSDIVMSQDFLFTAATSTDSRK